MSVGTEHPNGRRMRVAAEAIARGDMAAFLKHFPDDVMWYWPAEQTEDRLYRGHDGLMRFFGRLLDRSNGTMRPQVLDVVASDQHIVIFLRVTAARDSEHLDVVVAHFATVGPNGFTRNWFLPNDSAAWNRFFG